MKLNVIDIEALCWEPKSEQPEDQYQEVIEIGIAQLGLRDLKIIKHDSYLIKPKNSKCSSFCTELTGHSDDSLKNAKNFEEVLNRVNREYSLHAYTWASWGKYDLDKLYDECFLNGITPYKIFRNRHINIKNLMYVLENISREIGLKKALNFYNLEFIGRPHNGGDDAYNIARIMSHILNKYRRGVKV